MLPISKALKIIEGQTLSLGAERVSIDDAVGRFLAEDIVADSDLPPFNRSQMDGFAVRASDTVDAPITLRIIGESAAGKGWHGAVKKGETVRIMTGARVPAGADAVKRLEETRENSDGTVTILSTVKKGVSVVKKGDEVKSGTRVIKRGERIGDNLVAPIAAFGKKRLSVAKRPRVAIIGTGSEIVEIGKKPGPDQIRNSNSVMLKALAESAGASVRIFPNAGDDLSDLTSQISEACANADILVTTGGVSVGKYDLTKAALRELGADIFFERVRLKPGKPTVFAKRKKTLIFGLPGNPVSAAVTFHLFVRTAIRRMQGAAMPFADEGVAVARHGIKATKDRDSYLPAILTVSPDATLQAQTLKWGGSSDFIGYARAECLVVVPRGRPYAEGDIVKIIKL